VGDRTPERRTELPAQQPPVPVVADDNAKHADPGILHRHRRQGGEHIVGQQLADDQIGEFVEHQEDGSAVGIALHPSPPDLVHEADHGGDLLGCGSLAERVAAQRRTALDETILLMDVRIAQGDVPAQQRRLRQQQGHERGLADTRLPTDADEPTF